MNSKENINEYSKLPILDGVETLNAQDCTVNFPFHEHDTYNISLILKNSFTTRLTNKSFVAPIHSIVITNPNELHATPCDRDLGNSFFTFYVPTTIVNTICEHKDALFKDRVIHDKKIFKEFLWLSKKENTTNENFENKFINTLSTLLRMCEPDRFVESEDSDLEKYIKEIINEDKIFSLATLASKYGIDKFKFIRLFKLETGLTPKQYLLLKRIDKSKILLKKGSPILDVAIECGFYDAAHFYKYFNKYTGVNPLKFKSVFTS